MRFVYTLYTGQQSMDAFVMNEHLLSTLHNYGEIGSLIGSSASIEQK